MPKKVPLSLFNLEKRGDSFRLSWSYIPTKRELYTD